MKKRWQLLPLMLFFALTAFLWRGLSLNPQDIPAKQIGQTMPNWTLPSLNSEQQFTALAMKGQVALLNVWASWCSSCAEEQVFLLELAREGMPIFGINYKDEPNAANQWLSEWGNPYRAIGLDSDGKAVIDLGVYATPETFLVDKTGVIRYRHVGVLTAEAWQQEFLPRIHQLEKQ